MNDIIKKVTSYILVCLVLVFTVISLLAIWDVIDFEDVLRKIFLSLFVIFVASVVVLFIFSVLIKDQNKLE